MQCADLSRALAFCAAGFATASGAADFTASAVRFSLSNGFGTAACRSEMPCYSHSPFADPCDRGTLILACQGQS